MELVVTELNNVSTLCGNNNDKVPRDLYISNLWYEKVKTLSFQTAFISRASLGFNYMHLQWATISSGFKNRLSNKHIFIQERMYIILYLSKFIGHILMQNMITLSLHAYYCEDS